MKDVEKLSKFRGHPDWHAAFGMILETHDDLFFDHPEHGRCLPKANLEKAADLADRAFIEAIEDHKAMTRLFRRMEIANEPPSTTAQGDRQPDGQASSHP